METILIALPGIIKLIPLATTGVSNLIAWIASIRTASKQTGEWTAELEKLFIDALITKASTDAWKTDAELAAK